MDYSYTGVPTKPPWFVKLFAHLLKRRLLEKGFPAGAHIPKVSGGTHGIALVPTDQALVLLTKSYARLNQECPSIPNEAFGPLTQPE